MAHEAQPIRAFRMPGRLTGHSILRCIVLRGWLRGSLGVLVQDGGQDLFQELVIWRLAKLLGHNQNASCRSGSNSVGVDVSGPMQCKLA